MVYSKRSDLVQMAFPRYPTQLKLILVRPIKQEVP